MVLQPKCRQMVKARNGPSLYADPMSANNLQVSCALSQNGYAATGTFPFNSLDLSLSKALIETRPAAARTMSAV
eukprot:4411633-Amphidinium_carterae.2